MKTDREYSFAIILASLMSLFVISCSNDEPDDIIWDFVPVCFKIEIEDIHGNTIDQGSDTWINLLKNTSVEYDGQIYTAHVYTDQSIYYSSILGCSERCS